MNFLFTTINILSDEQNEENSEERYTPVSTESLSAGSLSKMQLLLRIRPTSLIGQKNSESNVYEVLDSSTLLIKNLDSYDAARRPNAVKPTDNLTRRKFRFTKIFNLETDQELFFREGVKPTVIDFLNNKSSTIISHGTAEAGKTYTLFGTITEPGIIPRSIEFIYSSLNCTLFPWYKPKDHKTIVDLDESDRAIEIDIRKKLLSCRYVDKITCKDVYEELENSASNENREIFKDSMYSVWISFVEIYNDAIFDLLEVDEDGKNMQLKLASDKHGATFIQGMRSVCATTGLEAYEILHAGQTRLSTVQSSSNYKSSRSHAIFTIKLLKYNNESNPSDVEMSCLSFCDLAGTGRIQRTISNDKQLKESRSINTSLLAFGRCLKVLAESHSRQSTGPFRDSKLTRLFQHSLQKENIILLINLNPNLELFGETQNVLNFASTAMKLTSEFAKEDKRLTDFYSPISSPKNEESHLSMSVNVSHEQDIEDIVLKNKQLQAELEGLKSHQLQKEFQLRKELTTSFTKQLNNLENTWKEREKISEEEKKEFIKFSVERVERFYRNQLEEYTNPKRKRIQNSDYQESLDVKVLEAENLQFNAKMSSMKEYLHSLTTENKELLEEKTRYAFELSLLKSELAKTSDFLESCFPTYGNSQDVTNLEQENPETQLNKNSNYYLQRIKDFVKKSVEYNNNMEKKGKSIILFEKEVQCSILHDFLKEVKELLDSSCVVLPEIDDSLEEQRDVNSWNVNDENLFNLLPTIKSCLAENISKVKELENENDEKSNQLKILNNKVWKNEMEIQQMNMRYQESEASRLSLSAKLKEFEKTVKSKEFFENPDFMSVESENSLSNESNPQLVFTEQISRNSFDNSNLSSLELESERVGNRATRSSSDSSGNDSGLASSERFTICRTTEDRFCQTSVPDGIENYSLQDRLMQLQLDYRRMKAQHGQESLRVTELSQELDNIKETLAKLKESSSMKEKAIADFQNKLSSNKYEIERLGLEKQKLEIKCDELTRQFQEATVEYEKKLNESKLKLKVREEGENRASKCLEDYWEKSVNLGSELSIAYSELEKASVRCYKEHIVKIDKLEKELNDRKVNENELEMKMIEYKNDLSEINNLSGKVHAFESLFNKIQKERTDLCRLINESFKNQSEVEEKLRDLVEKTEERDDQVTNLRSEIDTIIKLNLWNSRRAKDLGKEVADLLEKISSMKKDILQSEEARRNLEQNSSKEINNLRARLTIYEENAELLNLIHDTHENNQDVIDRLKLKVIEKEKQLEFFKKNRNATIQRYECLVHQLQDALKMNYQPSRTRKVSLHKHKEPGNNLKESISCSIHGSEQKINEWKSLCENHNHSVSCSSIRTLVYSPKLSTEHNSQDDLLVKSVEKSLQIKHTFNLRSHHVPCRDSDVLSNSGSLVEMGSSFDSEKR